MVGSLCGHCGERSFKRVEMSPRHSKYKITAIQCPSCGAVVRVMDNFNPGVDIHNIAVALGNLETQIESISACLPG